MSTIFRSKALLFFSIVVAIQGLHVIEHIIQLIQVYLFSIPEDDALGLLGYVFEFQGTEEWMHLVFNSIYLLWLYVLVPIVWRERNRGAVPYWAFAGFLLAGVGLESWHMVEHGVIISNVLANNGCPCPGIVPLPDSLLHFLYNLFTYAFVAIAWWFAFQNRDVEFLPSEDEPPVPPLAPAVSAGR